MRNTSSRTSPNGLQRLPDFDYSQAGAYFLTLCVEGRDQLLGEVDGEVMRPNALGRLVEACWSALPDHYRHVDLDAFVVMPNHVHGILILTPPLTSGEPEIVGAGFKPALQARRHGIPELVRALKTFSARSINEFRATPGTVVWQRNYHEHVVRDERALERIREYILDNPRRWGLDRENAERTGWDEFDRWIDSFSRPARRSGMTLES